MKYRLEISYDGTLFSGWQIQPHSPTIQDELEKALALVLKKKTRVIGAGRTDAGVHALKQVAHFETESSLDCRRVLHSLNGLLPKDIRINSLAETDDDFHAQLSALGKEYHYHLWTARVLPPFLYRYRCHCFDRISIPLLKKAAVPFVGNHDFATFTNAGSRVKSTIRTLHRIDIIEQEGGVRLEFEGDGFLYKMVRNLVGLLLEAAACKREIEELPLLLASKDRTQAGMAAPAKGLFLMRVFYPEKFGKEEASAPNELK